MKKKESKRVNPLASVLLGSVCCVGDECEKYKIKTIGICKQRTKTRAISFT